MNPVPLYTRVSCHHLIIVVTPNKIYCNYLQLKYSFKDKFLYSTPKREYLCP